MEASVKSETSPMIELDAQEFGLHLRQGGWRLGLLVARDVEPGEGQGKPRDDRREVEKVSAKWFAQRSGTSEHRVMRYYRAWERYADKGRVPHAADLSPGDEPDLRWDMLPHWTLSEAPSSGATGRLKLRIYLGHFADRQVKAHRRLATFLKDELPKQPVDNETRSYAGQLAGLLEADAAVLRQIEAAKKGEKLGLDAPKVEEFIQ